MSSNNLINETTFLLFVFLVGTYLIYFFGLKQEWHELRKQNKFVAENNSMFPKATEKNILGKYMYWGLCSRLFFFSTIISGSICLFFVFTVPSLRFDSIKDMIGALFLFIPLWALFLDVSLSKEVVINPQHTKVFGYLYSFMAWIKEAILNHIIAIEKKLIYDLIHSYINQWYVDWTDKKDIKLGVLILRIDENYLDRLVTNEEIKGLKREIMLSFSDKEFTLVDLLNRFFTVEVERNGVIYDDILAFLKMVEVTSLNQDRNNFDNRLQQCITKARKYSDLPVIEIRNVDSVTDLKKMLIADALTSRSL